MNKRHKFAIGIGLILLTVLVIAGMISILRTDQKVTYYVAAIAIILTAALAFYYLIDGAKKDVAVYFHWYAVAYAVMEGLTVLALVNSDASLIAIALRLISFASTAVIAEAKNLGKKSSRIYSGLIVIINIVLVVTFATTGHSLTGPASMLILSLILFVMVDAKYIDKDARGTI